MSDERLSKQTVSARASRASQDRQVTEDREFTDAERLEMFRQATAQAILPDIPPIPGFHVVWLSAANPKDTLHARKRQGYSPVTSEDVKGYEFVSDKGNESDGLIRVNEMVAFKLPIHLYNLYMRELHHNQPFEQEGRITDGVARIQAEARGHGVDVDEGDGVEALRKLDSIRVPEWVD